MASVTSDASLDAKSFSIRRNSVSVLIRCVFSERISWPLSFWSSMN